MAELHLTVTYNKKQRRALMWLAYGVFPLWSLIAPATLAIFIVYMIKFPMTIPPLFTIAILLVLSSVFFSGLFYTAYAEDKSIHVTKEGISFPLFLMAQLRLKRHKNWDELVSADYIETSQDNYLKLTFKEDITIHLSSRSLQEEKLEELLLALELWGKNCTRSDRLIAYQKEVQTNNTENHQIGYTQMWEEELSRRFHATTFIPLEPGKELKGGSLVIQRQMAFGGLSAIYLVQKDNKDLFVLKEAVVPPDVDEENKRQAEQYIERESKMLAQISHKNIASVVDYFVEEDRNYLLLEYINGQDLRQLISQNGTQNESVVVDWALQIAGAIKYLHSQEPQIIHRDLTPDNLVLKEDGTVIIIDFGAANEFVGTATGTLIGKQAYIAPEQLRGKAVPASDFYALGGTMFFLLTGRDPTPLAQPELEGVLPDSNKELSQLLKDLTEFETADRIDSVDQLLTRLNNIKEVLPSKQPDTASNQE